MRWEDTVSFQRVCDLEKASQSLPQNEEIYVVTVGGGEGLEGEERDEMS